MFTFRYSIIFETVQTDVEATTIRKIFPCIIAILLIGILLYSKNRLFLLLLEVLLEDVTMHVGFGI